MAKAVADGHRVVLVTGTRGEQGEIVVPEMDTPENHRRLGELRAVELERAMAVLGVTEWENLGYRDSDMMGRPGQPRPADLLAGRPRRGRRPADLARPALPARRDHDLQRFGGYGHPDHIRTHDVVDPRVRAGGRSGLVSGAARRGRRRAAGRRRSSTSRRSRPRSATKMAERLKELGKTSFWEPPEDATPGAARRVRGVRGEDARPRRADHDLARHLGRPARPQVASHPAST